MKLTIIKHPEGFFTATLDGKEIKTAKQFFKEYDIFVEVLKKLGINIDMTIKHNKFINGEWTIKESKKFF